MRSISLFLRELPPRARRILENQLKTYADLGTTSACAENTHADRNPARETLELPPRARRILAKTQYRG